MHKIKSSFTPDPAQMALWPRLSGNAINGLGETLPGRPRPIYWHDPDSTPHGALQRWFYARSQHDPRLTEARAERQKALDQALSGVAAQRVEMAAADWTALIKTNACALGADLVGIARMRPEWVFEGYQVPQRWVVMVGVAHAYEQMKHAPGSTAAAEVVRQYARGIRIVKQLASAIREHGYDAHPHGGPAAGPVLLPPPALACGFGELGKHGSIINRKFGSSFRLACVLTDLPLLSDQVDKFGADDYCVNCRLCVNACPPDAIFSAKQLVRSETKWYVDFDKCLPYFNESMGCGVCIAVCPWSRPGVADNLLRKLARL